MPLSVAIQGEEGSNSAAAARELCGPEVSLQFCGTFAEVFDAVAGARATAAVLPCENTTAGLIQEVMDRLSLSDLAVHAEAKLRIAFAAAAIPGAKPQVQRILCHPVAAAQCMRFLVSTGWQIAPCHDTAGAARLVAEGRDPSVAALCPPSAAERYGLEVVARDVADEPVNFTRFLLLAPAALPMTQRGPANRTMVIFTAEDTPGSLVRALTAFASRGLNLCALHSRSLPGHPGEYRFLMEIEAGAEDPRCAAALRELQVLSRTMRTLGSYAAPPWPVNGG